MNQRKLALALLVAVGASGVFAIWLLRSDGEPLFQRSRIETVSSAPPRNPDTIAATALSSYRFREADDRCRWHSGNRLNSPEWWLAEYYRGVQERRPTNAQIDELEALLATIELELSAADLSVSRELTPAVEEKNRHNGDIRRNEFKSLHSKAGEDHGPDAISSRTKNQGGLYASLLSIYDARFGRKSYGTFGIVDCYFEGKLITSLPWRYDAEFSGLPSERADPFEFLVGERPALDVALDARATLHHDAPKRVQRLIESFK